MTQGIPAGAPSAEWQSLYRVGGAAALLAGILFRRNIAAEISLLGAQGPPDSVEGWFALLQDSPLLGLAYLNVFDLANYALLGLMFLALWAVLRGASRSWMAIATTSAFAGIVVYFASNTAFSMLALSHQYAVATTDAQRAALAASGQTMLAVGRFTGNGGHPGAGGYASLLLIASAGIIVSVVMLRSGLFSRATALVGVLAGALGVAYCLAYALILPADGVRLGLVFIPAAGLFLMIWHLMVGWKLLQLSRERPAEPADRADATIRADTVRSG